MVLNIFSRRKTSGQLERQLEKKISKTQSKEREDRLSLETLTRIKKRERVETKAKKVRGALFSRSPAGKALKSVRGLKAPTRKQFRTQTSRTRRAAGLLLPTSTSGGRTGRRGRPTGSYKYGMPIQQYKKLLRRRKALARLQAHKAIQEGVPPEVAIAQSQPSREQLPESEYRREVQVARPIVSHNILQAPNVFRGEMIGTGGQNNPVTPLSETSRPIANPRGEYFQDVDLMSGRPILKRRVTEKWLTN